MKTVRDIIPKKLKDIPSISADATVYAAITLMTERQLDALVVLEKKQLVGTLHQRECMEKILLWGQRSRETKVKEIMRKNPMTVRPDDSLETCVIYMLTEGTSQLPVLDKTNVIAVVSSEDILKAGLQRPGIIAKKPTSVSTTTLSTKDDRVWNSRNLN